MKRDPHAMTFWGWLYCLGPGWPQLKERQLVSMGVFALVVMMLWMAKADKTLWDIELFKLLLTTFSVTGLVNMVLGFHYSATKNQETATENTGKAFDAVHRVADQIMERPTGQPGDPVHTAEEGKG